MAKQSIIDTNMRSTGSSSDTNPSARVTYSDPLKKTVRPAEVDATRFSSAFLADRGCFSQGKSQKPTAA
jgi:hypothetical protein